jgi:hypothetical protein
MFHVLRINHLDAPVSGAVTAIPGAVSIKHADKNRPEAA